MYHFRLLFYNDCVSELRVRFGKRLRKLRISKGLVQEQLAEKAGVSADFISLIERGYRAPSFETIQKLAKILQVEVSYFFVESKE